MASRTGATSQGGRRTWLQLTSFIILASQLLFGVTLAQNCGASGHPCAAGLCCSIYGYCGSTSQYCGAGKCGSQCSNSPTPGGPGTPGNGDTPSAPGTRGTPNGTTPSGPNAPGTSGTPRGPGTGAPNCGSTGPCASGFCCSKYGYCGSTSEYCGVGNCVSQC